MPSGGSVYLHGSVLDTGKSRPPEDSDVDLLCVWPGLDRAIYRMVCQRLRSLEIAGHPVRVEPRIGPCLPRRRLPKGAAAITIQPQILPDIGWLSPATRLALDWAAQHVSGEPIPPYDPAGENTLRIRDFLWWDLARVREMICGQKTWYWKWSEEGAFERRFRSVAIGNGKPTRKLRRHAAGILARWAMVLSMRDHGHADSIPPGVLLQLASCVEDVREFEALWLDLFALNEKPGE